MKKHGIKYSALKTACFSTHNKDRNKILGPIVIWIATHPNTTSTENTHDVLSNILHILKEHKVEGVVVKWYKGSVENLSGPALMCIVDKTNPTHYVHCPFTAVLGMPITIKERKEKDAQGTVSFHKNKDKNGKPSARVLAVSNKHVLHKDMTMEYWFMGSGTPCQYVWVCRPGWFQHFISETGDLVTKNITEAVQLTEEIAQLEAKLKSEDQEQVEEDKDTLEIKRYQLNKMNEDNSELWAFLKVANNQWHDLTCWTIGFIDWVPSISFDVNDHHYTQDISTVELDLQKFKDNFQGNLIDLGVFYLISLVNIHLT